MVTTIPVLILVSYDVKTEDADGRRRLRKVAKVCKSYGQRVQNSVFECMISLMQLEEMEMKLLKIINLDQDNLRIYRLNEASNWKVKQYGCFRSTDFSEPLVI